MQRAFTVAAAAALFVSPAFAADDSKPKTNAESKAKAPAASDEIAKLALAAKGEKAGAPIHQLVSALDAKLQDKETGAATAKEILDRMAEFELGATVEKSLQKIAADKKQAAAAQLLLQCVRARLVTKTMKKGGVVLGQVVVEDGKLSPEMVLAQMPISAEGYFAGEVGDMKKPVNFRAAGYEDVEAKLDGKSGEFFDVGVVTMKPMPKGSAVTLKGKVQLEIADRGPATMSLSLMVPKPNTPHGGYSPRRGWPKPTEVKLEADGSFSVPGLTPGDYYMMIQAKDHAQKSEMVKVGGGGVTDKGVIKLSTTDLGFYIGKAAPKTGELPWEKDYTAAMKKAEAEKKPVMVMMTATWCGPCKMLEKDVLNDPWVKQFLSGFVIVKAYEDKDVEAKYPMNGYPTLVFLDSTGKEKHRTSGYQPSPKFLSECVKGMKKLAVEVPADLKTLVEKKVVEGG